MFNLNFISQVIAFIVCISSYFGVFHTLILCILDSIKFPHVSYLLDEIPLTIGIRTLGLSVVPLIIHALYPCSFTLPIIHSNQLMSLLNIFLGLYIHHLQKDQFVKWSDKEKADFKTHMFYCVGFPLIYFVISCVFLLVYEL